MMMKAKFAAGLVCLAALAPASASAAALPGSQIRAGADAFAREHSIALQPVQYRNGYRGGGGYYRGGGPGYYRGGPGWGYRPWYGRPYYGTIIGGIALGTIIGVTAYGLAPARPRPDLCWYWSDRQQSRGYWDYC